jgi:hypothetical protein
MSQNILTNNLFIFLTTRASSETLFVSFSFRFMKNLKNTYMIPGLNMQNYDN